MARVTVKTEGFKELQEALLELPKATGRNVARRALLKAAKPIAEAASANAPIGPTGKLHISIDAGTQLTRRQRSQHTRASEVEVFVGVTNAAPHGMHQEFGTAHNPPQPFLRPAFDGNVQQSLAIIRTELWNEIGKAAERLARKAARLAAKSTGA